MLYQSPYRFTRWLAAGLIALGAARAVVEYRAAHGAELSDWRAQARWCLDQQPACGVSCSGAWENISRCVVRRVAPPPPGLGWVVDVCISTVRDRAQNEPMGFDRVGPVLACVTRSPVR
jgi:hypothetical protein